MGFENLATLPITRQRGMRFLKRGNRNIENPLVRDLPGGKLNKSVTWFKISITRRAARDKATRLARMTPRYTEC